MLFRQNKLLGVGRPAASSVHYNVIILLFSFCSFSPLLRPPVGGSILLCSATDLCSQISLESSQRLATTTTTALALLSLEQPARYKIVNAPVHLIREMRVKWASCVCSPVRSSVRPFARSPVRLFACRVSQNHSDLRYQLLIGDKCQSVFLFRALSLSFGLHNEPLVCSPTLTSQAANRPTYA